MGVNWQMGLVDSGRIAMNTMAAFEAGRDRALQDQDRKRQESARQAASDYFISRHTPGVMSAAVDRSSDGMAGPSGGSASQLAAIGQQYTRPDDALVRLAQADPAQAYAIEERERKMRADDLELQHKLNAATGRLLAGIHDQASYDAAIGRARKMFSRFGENLDDYGVPPVYDPDTVQALRMQTLDVDRQLAAERGAKRLEWDIEDDQLDNERADRNTDSVINSRDASTAQGWQRVGIQREGMERTDARGRRGQDIASADRRRGQDMTDRRARDGVNKPKGRGSAGRGGAGPVATDGKGNKVQWNGKAWVPVR